MCDHRRRCRDAVRVRSDRGSALVHRRNQPGVVHRRHGRDCTGPGERDIRDCGVVRIQRDGAQPFLRSETSERQRGRVHGDSGYDDLNREHGVRRTGRSEVHDAHGGRPAHDAEQASFRRIHAHDPGVERLEPIGWVLEHLTAGRDLDHRFNDPSEGHTNRRRRVERELDATGAGWLSRQQTRRDVHGGQDANRNCESGNSTHGSQR